MPGAAAAQTGRVPVRAPDGTIGSVPASELSALPEGAEVLTPEDVRKAALEEKYGGTGGEAAAAGLGAARGATFGLLDPAAIKLAGAFGSHGAGERTREALSGYKEANPIASTGGELVGAAAPVLLSGGAGAGAEGLSLARGARALGAIPRGAAALGGLAERAAAGVVGEGAESLLGRAVQKGVSSAVGGGFETALYGGGHELSEEALGNEQANGEKIASAMARDFFLGAGVGGALGVGGELAKTGLLNASGVALGRRGEETVAEALERASGEHAFKAAGGTKAMTANADKFAGGADAVGKIWREEVPELLGKKTFGELSRADLAEAAPLLKRKAGQQLDASLDQLDSLAATKGGQPHAGEILADVERKIVEPLRQSAAGAAGERAVQNFLDRQKQILGLVDKAGNAVEGAEHKLMSFRQLRDFRKAADELWAGNKINPTEFSPFKDVRDLLEEHLISGGDRIAHLSGKEFKGDYEAAKRLWQAGKLLEKATGSGLAAQGTNRFLSLTDNIVGTGMAHLGGVVGSAFGPLGAAAGAAVAGGAGAVLNKIARQRFDFAASDLAAKVAHFGAIRRVTTSVDHELEGGVRAFLRPRSQAAAAARADDALSRRPHETRAKAFERTSQQITALSSNLPALQDRIAHHVDPLATHAPKTSSAVAATLAGDVAFLASKLPAGRIDPTRMQQQLQKPRAPSDLDIDKFEGYMRAFKNPRSVLDEMKKGRVSREGVEFLKLRRPELYSQVQKEIAQQLLDPKAPELTYQQEIQLSILFGQSKNATLEPSFIRDMQGSFAGGSGGAQSQGGNDGGAPPGASPGAPRRPLNVAQGFETEAQRLERK